MKSNLTSYLNKDEQDAATLAKARAEHAALCEIAKLASRAGYNDFDVSAVHEALSKLAATRNQ